MINASPKSLIFLSLLAAAFLLPTTAPQAVELVNHTYHWYKNDSNKHDRIKSNGRTVDVNVLFTCGALCSNSWIIRPKQVKSILFATGHIYARDWHWGKEVIRPAEQYLEHDCIRRGRANCKDVAVHLRQDRSCSKTVGLKREGIASQLVPMGKHKICKPVDIRDPTGAVICQWQTFYYPKLYC